MTARDVYELAIALLDESDSDSEENYPMKAPQLIDILQRELAFYEGKTVSGKVENMDSVLSVSDDTAARIMPYGLAASFALADRNADMYNDYSYMYRALIRTIRPEECSVSDEYGVLDGMS
ncbi:MAG: hypothetical protein ACM3S4_07375 [Burkholderiales bacterium]